MIEEEVFFKNNTRYAHRRGKIRESAIKALVHDPLFRQRVEKPKSGKGSYKRERININSLEKYS